MSLPELGLLPESQRSCDEPPKLQQSDADYKAKVAESTSEAWERRPPPRERQPQPPAESQTSQVESGPEWLEQQHSAHAEHWQAKHAKLFADAEAEASHQLRARRPAIRRELARVDAHLRQLGRVALPQTRSRGPRGTVRRPAARRGATRARAPSGDSSGSEPPGSDDGPGDDFTDADACYAAAHVVALYPAGLTPARFRATTLPFVHGLADEQLGNARLRIFIQLPDVVQRAFYRHLTAENGCVR